MEEIVDRVAEIQAAWARERPDLDVRPQGVIGRLHRLAAHLTAELEIVYRRHGLSEGEFDVLAALRRAGAPYQLSPGRLLRETLVTSGTMTNRVDRLAGRGLVERLPDPSDRRGVLVQLTPKGRDTVDGADASLLELERPLLSALGDEDQDRLAGLLRKLATSVGGSALG